MLARTIALLTMIVAAVTSGSSQQALLVAPVAGVTITSASFRQLGPLVLPERATGLSSSPSWLIGARFGAVIGLTTDLSLVPSVAWTLFRSEATATEQTSFAINGTLVPGTFTHSYAITTSGADVGVDLRYKLGPMVLASVGVGAMVITSMTGTQTMSITDPSGVTFLDGTSSHEVASGDIPERKQVLPIVNASVSIPLHVGGMQWEGELGARIPIGSMVSGSTLSSTTVLARLNLRFDLTQPSPLPLPQRAPRVAMTVPTVQPSVPTAILAPPAMLALPPSVAPSLFALCDVMFKQKNGKPDTRGVVRIDRTLMITHDVGPATGVRTTVDTLLRADPPRIVFRPTVQTDDSIASWTVSVRIGDTTVFTQDGTAEPPREIEWDCASVSASLFKRLIQDTAVVMIEAVGRQGGRSVSAPTIIRLRDGSASVRTALDTARMNATVWGYDVNDAEPPLWARTFLSGLRPFARRCPDVTIYGSADGDAEHSANRRVAEQRAQRVAVLIGAVTADLSVDPVPPSPSPRNDRDRRVRIVMRNP